MTELTEAQKAKVAAYYRGRNAVWYELSTEAPKEFSEELKAEFLAGVRSARREMALDRDTSWD
jgi:hypothetical protein